MQNSSEVISWFKNIKNKNLHTVTVFDIQEFYPFITEQLLKDSILFAQTSAGISSNDIEIVFHCRKSLLYHDNQPWIKETVKVILILLWVVLMGQKYTNWQGYLCWTNYQKLSLKKRIVYIETMDCLYLRTTMAINLTKQEKKW